MLGAGGMKRLLAGLSAILPNRPAEFTVEANPESAGEKFLSVCKDGGITRISLGVQSFHEPSRRSVHRVGSGVNVPERIRSVAGIFGKNFSADLITGLPFQTEKILLHDIETLLMFNPDHVSLYALTIGEGTPLAKAIPALPAADEADRLWLRGRDTLAQAGYAQYEVSNFARTGRESRHNIRYWRMENWLGLGPAASGTIIDDREGRGLRRTVKADTAAWLDRKTGEEPPVTEEILERETLIKETFLMGFRYIEGPDRDLFERRFGRSIEAMIPETLAKWRDRGFVYPDRIAMTAEGLLFLDPFLIDLFKELDNTQLK
jgi:oxygen-independent coproporphyrinogen-3 oxidase